jgi:hypothetical protein
LAEGKEIGKFLDISGNLFSLVLVLETSKHYTENYEIFLNYFSGCKRSLYPCQNRLGDGV